MTTLTRAPLRAPAARALGVAHPLAHADERVRRLDRHAALVAALGAAAAGLTVAGIADLRAVVVAAAAVLAALAGLRVGAASARRDRAVQVVADGRAGLPVAAVQREARRLANPRRAPALGRSIDALRRDARIPYRCRRSRPLFVPAVIRALDPQLAALSAALQRGPVPVVATARAELLLGAWDSPLYGDDERRLRDDIGRIAFAIGG